ncbi:MAG: SAM-dependent methyltransferase [Clostridia bacterium]|nr:SAM-dependent methyltransferase [Clostridia bacterium]
MSGGVLGARLLSAAGFVRQGAVFADVGTDHAYLPIFLLECGRVLRAVCSDINSGPLESARQNIEAAGLSDRCELVLSDGAAALSDKGITDYAICGMGGELIAEIIDAAPALHKEGVNLILQPMTRPRALRKYLCENGFEILSEAYSEEGAKHYVCINARYTGAARMISDVEAEIGLKEAEIVNKDVQKRYLSEKKRSLLRTIEGKTRGGEDADYERAACAEIERILKQIEE